MNSRHLVDHEILPLLDLPLNNSFTHPTLPQQRTDFINLVSSVPVPLEPRVDFRQTIIPGLSGSPDVRIIIYRPIQADGLLPAILHIHGGGYVLGTADLSRAANQVISAELPCVVVSVDYRLAPETPHPGPVEDCYTALRWLHDHAAALGVDSTRIGVSGESAGGGLAAGLALLARDRGEVRLAFQHLIYPMIDDRTVLSGDPHPYSGEFIWTADANRFGWQALLGGTAVGAHDVSPYAAAARAEDLAGLPPTFISVGALDLFLDENLEFCRRLSRSGVPVELHVYPGAVHGFQMIADARVSRNAERDSIAALRRFVE